MKHGRYKVEAIERLFRDDLIPLALRDWRPEEIAEFVTLVVDTMGEVADSHAATVELELGEGEVCDMMRLAHERDITFNEFIEVALEAAIREALAEKDEEKAEGDKAE